MSREAVSHSRAGSRLSWCVAARRGEPGGVGPALNSSAGGPSLCGVVSGDVSSSARCCWRRGPRADVPRHAPHRADEPCGNRRFADRRHGDGRAPQHEDDTDIPASRQRHVPRRRRGARGSASRSRRFSPTERISADLGGSGIAQQSQARPPPTSCRRPALLATGRRYNPPPCLATG